MTVVSDPLARPQGLALEEELGSQLGVPVLSNEASSFYKLGGEWTGQDFLPSQQTYGPQFTLLNPAYYPHVKGLPWGD